MITVFLFGLALEELVLRFLLAERLRVFLIGSLDSWACFAGEAPVPHPVEGIRRDQGLGSDELKGG